MSPVLDAVAVLVLVGLAVAVVLAVTSSRGTPPPAEVADPRRVATVSDRHRHRWTRWEVIDERKIHLYGEVDEGRDLPDRIDVVLRRECARCGLPQTQTVRGLDPKQHG